MRRHHQPDPLRRDTVRGLLDGLGAEDIAVKHGYSPDAVRGVIAALRQLGVLDTLVRQARK